MELHRAGRRRIYQEQDRHHRGALLPGEPSLRLRLPAAKRRDAVEIRKSVVAVVAVALIGWVGYSAYNAYDSYQPKESVEIDYTAMDNLTTDLSE